MNEFNYERGELEKLDSGVIVKMKLRDDAGNQTHWLTLQPETFAAIQEALIEQGAQREH